ncbi:MAG: alpha/beta fold hydrolase [Anaerolineae bacterium]|nr:alpha/beta fold hydrolase [Anaerolineae bacterium]
MTTSNTFIHNPHLEGDTFFWEAGPVGVLLAHGYTASTAEVRLLGRFLHRQGYTVAGPLLPGHMTTPQQMNHYRWQDWAGALEAAYQQIAARCEQVFVGGESMGALLALYLASEHPETAGLLIYAPALRILPGKALLARLLAPVVPYMRKQCIEPTERWQGYTVNPIPALVQMLHLQGEVDRRLAGICQPLLLIQGRLDSDIDLRGVNLLYQKIGSPFKELHWLEHSRHAVILDRELDQVTELTQRFIERILE